jgi:hypothetical protein
MSPAALNTIVVIMEFDWYCTRPLVCMNNKAAGGFFGFQKATVSLLERKKTYSMTSDAS